MVLASAGGAVAFGWSRYVPGDGPCAGLRIAGETLPPRTDLPAWVAERARGLSERHVHLGLAGVPSFSRDATLAELGVRIDVGRVVALARSIGHEGTLADRIHAALEARRGAIDVPLPIDVDAATVTALLAPVKDRTDEPPVPAKLDLEQKTVVPHQSGHYLDLDGAIAAIRAAATDGADAIELPRVDVAPRVSSEFLEHLDIHETLAKFETHFGRAGDQASRAHNIDNAAARLDGVVLMPHELVSFNAIVGPRSIENGFSKGWEIFKGEMVEGIGGGTCQVASTLHAAAYLAGLDVVERLPHSRPSAYITMGLDSTVVFPSVDLKLRNPYDFPIVVHSHVSANVITFELLGREAPAKVTFGRDVVGSKPYGRKVEEMAGLPSGKIVRKQHGIRGYTVRRVRRVALRDGTERVESNVDVYPPTTEIYLVPPGTDADAVLPPLPEAAPPEGAETGAVASAPAAKPDADPDAPKIVDSPGSHRPTWEQANAPARIVITGH